MKIENTENVIKIAFGGTVFMYGNIQVIIEKREDKVFIIKSAGNDGFTGEVLEKESTIQVFDEIISAISNMNIETQISDEDEDSFIAEEPEEDSGAYEWYLGLCDDEDDFLWSLNGYNPESSAFKKISENLKNICKDFGEIESFFENVNE